MAAKWILRWQYQPGSLTMYGQSHEASRQAVKEGLNHWVQFVRTRYGCDISHRQATSGGRVRISFGRDELQDTPGVYGLGMVRSSDRSRIWLLGDARRPAFRDRMTLGKVIAHEFMHTARVKSNPSADSHGHSVRADDIFAAGLGSSLTQSLAWWKRLGGMIPGWKPKTKAVSEADEMMTLAMPSMGQDFDLRPCGCGG